MVRFLKIMILLILVNISWPVIAKQFQNNGFQEPIENIESEMKAIKNSPELLASLHTLYEKVQSLMNQLGLQLEDISLDHQNIERNPSEKLELKTPSQQIFSIHNIELGEAKEEIERSIGMAKRASLNEYGTNWYAFHHDYQDFFMIMYDENNKVAGLYTNQDLISSTNGIKMGSSKEIVRSQLGEPETAIQKGFVIYQLNEKSDYDLFLLDDAYVTIFYDKHEGDTVTAMQLISKDLEDKKTSFYTKESPLLKEGFEFQLFDLTNAVRSNHQLPILSWDDHVKETARKHSTDMAENQYFDHTNLKGQSPFDRMENDHILFHLAGENLATGQLSSIFAHEGLMNSLGHRENILRKDYKYLGVGVAFNHQSHPYYTENFYAK